MLGLSWNVVCKVGVECNRVVGVGKGLDRGIQSLDYRASCYDVNWTDAC